MKFNNIPETNENPFAIITGIITVYILLIGFCGYFYFLHKINLAYFISISAGITIAYFPRLLLITKLIKQDDIKIVEDFIMINGIGVNFADIEHYGIKEFPPEIIFFMNNKMIVYKEADFCLRTGNEEFNFKVSGNDKIKLIKTKLSRHKN